MLSCAFVVALAPTWFGPVTVDFDLPTEGNPFSPRENDVRAVFRQGSTRHSRFAYFAEGRWHATLAASKGGEYQVSFERNGRPVGTPKRIRLMPAKDSEFVRLAGKRFRLSSGKPFIPHGHNFGWQNGGQTSYEKQLADMAAAGLNWTRVWANHWDRKNPYMPPDRNTPLELGRMWEPALDRWDMVVENCEKNGIKLQFVLFHHGLVTTFNDSNWADNPWNAVNGGFLKDPADFFNDDRAKELTRNWLRYAVARWGHSPSIMAWELFNEVQWVNAARDPKRRPEVAAWHAEMAKYLRQIDPYHHLVTSSSNEGLPASVFAAMDFDQPHTYPPSVFGALLGTKPPANKPMFFGEFGATGGLDRGAKEYLVVRDGFWGGLLGDHSGPGAYWYWDRAYRGNLYPEYRRQSRILDRSGFAEHPKAVPGRIAVLGVPPAKLIAQPGRGWEATEKFIYELPGDASTGSLAQLSTYIQGAKSGNRMMMPQPIRFRFRAEAPGKARFKVGQVARQGGQFEVRVNGGEPVLKSWEGGEGDRRVNEEVVVDFSAGAVEIAVDNPGGDWVTLEAVQVDGVGLGVSAAVLSDPDYALGRLTWKGRFGSAPKTLTLSGITDGRFELRQFDLEKGTERTLPVNVQRGRVSGYRPFALDEGFALMRVR